MTDAPTSTCPVCGLGTLVTLTFDEGSAESEAEPKQRSDSRQVDTYSCGHEMVGGSLAGADSGALAVERRTSEETTDNPESDDHPSS